MIQSSNNNPRNVDNDSLCQKKYKAQKSSRKLLASVLWNDIILLVQYPVNGLSIIPKYYVALITKLKEQLIFKHQRKLSKGILFLQDNAAFHKAAIMHHKLADLHFEVLECPA
jgi:hypothetical protein